MDQEISRAPGIGADRSQTGTRGKIMMSPLEQTHVSTQVYRVYIKAAPQAVWDAITKPEWTARYGYGGRMEYDLRSGGAIRGYTSEAMKQGGAAQAGAQMAHGHGCGDHGGCLYPADLRDFANPRGGGEIDAHPRPARRTG